VRSGSLTLPGAVLAQLWSRSVGLGEERFVEACADVGLDEAFAKGQPARYEICAETDFDGPHLRLASWLVWRCGSGTAETPMIFESQLPPLPTGRLVAPGWVLGIAGSGVWRQRLPCRFLAPVADEAIAEAYEGLVAHIEDLGRMEAAGELSHTGALWRIAGLVEALDEDPTRALNARVDVIRERVKRSRFFAAIEKDTWRHIDGRFADRRNALSHLSNNSGMTFAECVAHALMENGAGVLTAAAAVSLAIAQQIATELRGGLRENSMAARAVESEIGGIDV
jgi:hypothetical protein